MIISEMEIRLRADIARLQRDMDAARDVVGRATAGMERAAAAAKSALASIGAGLGLQQLAQMTDEYAKFTAQLKLATQTQREYATAYADVKRISTQSTQGLQETGVLYARIANGTRELGIAQQQVAAITETVNLSLLVSGATASESASAQLQLAQAFASGTLRGEEFNAVNEAAPRLMQALADGIGVPVGALKKMAEEGEITSKIMSDVLPNALTKLRNEAKEVQTISGAFTVLRNEVMEFVGVQAQANGVVATTTSALTMLAQNLGMVAGSVAVIAGARLVGWLSNVAGNTLNTVAANRAFLASNYEVARSEAAASAQASTLANARVVEIRAATLAASGNVQLALTYNGLLPAMRAADAATVVHNANLERLSIAQRAASVSGAALAAGSKVLSGVLAMTGGPLGLIIMTLGIAAMAWTNYGDKAKEAAEKAKGATEKSTQEMVDELTKETEKLQERIDLARNAGMRDAAQMGGEKVERLSALNAQINKLLGDINSGFLPESERTRVIELQYEYTKLNNALENVGRAKETLAGGAQADMVREWFGTNGTAAQKLSYELEQLRKKFGGELPAAIEKAVRAKYADKGTAQAIKQEASAYENLITSIREKMAANELELQGYDKLSDSQKMTIKLDAAIGTGKNKLSAGHIAETRANIEKIAVQEKAIDAKQRAAKWAEIEEKNEAERLAALRASTAAVDQRVQQMEREIDTYGLSTSAAIDMEKAKLEAKLASGVADHAELAALDAQIEKMETLAALARNKEGLDANKKAVEDQLAAQKQVWGDIERTARDTFISIFDSGKSAFDRLKDALKNGLLDLLYQMTLKKWIINIGASMGVGGVSGFAQAAGAAGGGGSGLTELVQGAANIYKMAANGFAGVGGSIGQGVSYVGNAMGSNSLYSFGQGMQGMSAGGIGSGISPTAAGFGQIAGTAAGYLGGAAAGVYGGRAISNGFSLGGGSGNTAVNVGTAIGAVIAGPIGAAIGGAIGGLANRAFGMKAKEVTATGIRGTLSGSGATGESYSSWKQEGGWFRSDKSGTDRSALSGDIVKQFSEGFDALKLASSSFASSMGVSAASLSTYSRQFDIALGKDQAANEKAVADFFTQVGDEMAYRLVPSLGQFVKSGESASAALQRLAGDFQATDAMAQLLGKSAAAVFGSSGIGSAAARERLVALAGGVDVLMQQASAYSQNFLTEAQRLKPVSDALAAAMGGLGLSAVTTRAQFKQVIDGLDLTSEAGAKQYVAMMGLAEAFAMVHPATVDLADQRSALADAYRAEADALQETMTRMGSFAASLRDLGKSAKLGNLSPLSPQQKYAEAKAQYEAVVAAARGGDADAQSKYQGAFSSFLEASRSVYASSAQYQRDFDYADAVTEEAARWAEAQVDVGQAQLDVLKSQVSGIIEVNKSVLSVRDALLQFQAAEGKNTAPLTAVAPPMNTPIPYSSYGASNTTALVAEVKALRTEVAGLRVDQRQQTGDQIEAQFAAAEGSANRIANSVKAVSYREERVLPE